MVLFNGFKGRFYPLAIYESNHLETSNQKQSGGTQACIIPYLNCRFCMNYNSAGTAAAEGYLVMLNF